MSEPHGFDPALAHRARVGAVFAAICFAATIVGVIVLALLLADILVDGAGALSLDFLNRFPSRLPSRAGIKPALIGSAWVMGLTAVISFPLGVGTAIWLEEYAPNNRWTRVVETNIANLAGVPSIVYGILGLALFVRAFALGLVLFLMTLTLNVIAIRVVRKYREQYE